MSFKDIEIKTEYRSGKSNVIGDFYIPVPVSYTHLNQANYEIAAG